MDKKHKDDITLMHEEELAKNHKDEMAKKHKDDMAKKHKDEISLMHLRKNVAQNVLNFFTDILPVVSPNRLDFCCNSKGRRMETFPRS